MKTWVSAEGMWPPGGTAGIRGQGRRSGGARESGSAMPGYNKCGSMGFGDYRANQAVVWSPRAFDGDATGFDEPRKGEKKRSRLEKSAGNN